jgi:hypothetical protein
LFKQGNRLYSARKIDRKRFSVLLQKKRKYKMRKPIILGGNPYINDYYNKDSKSLFEDTGGNSGNLAFQYAISNHIPSATLVPWGKPVAEIRNSGDIIVLPLANQLGKHTDLNSAAARLEDINLPVLGIGLGAQAVSIGEGLELTEGTKRWLKIIATLSPSSEPNIGVRGPYTQEKIIEAGFQNSSLVMGCPSNFINMKSDTIEQVAKGYRRRPKIIAVTAGIPHIPHLASLERDLASIVTATGGAYIVQHGLEMLQLARREFDVMDQNSLNLCHEYIAPNKSMDEFKSWCRQYAYAFYDCRAWLDFMRRFDFVVGTRFHGAMLAIQAGVPAACIAHDSRTQEMCETMRIPVRHYSELKGLTEHNLLDYFKFDAESYIETRKILLKRYLSIYSNAEVSINPRLVSI